MTTTADSSTQVDELLEGPLVTLAIGDIVLSVIETRWLAQGRFPESREVVVDDGSCPVALSYEKAQDLPAKIRDFADRVESMLANFGHLGGDS